MINNTMTVSRINNYRNRNSQFLKNIFRFHFYTVFYASTYPLQIFQFKHLLISLYSRLQNISIRKSTFIHSLYRNYVSL